LPVFRIDFHIDYVEAECVTHPARVRGCPAHDGAACSVEPAGDLLQGDLQLGVFFVA